MVRLWKASNSGEGSGDPVAWHGEVEDIQSGNRQEFTSLDSLLIFVYEQVVIREIG